MEKIYKLGQHLVAFLDVLGQREKFRGLKTPTNPDEEKEVKEALRQTAGFVVELRTVLQAQFEAFEAGAMSMQRHTKKSIRPSFIGFSDCFVTSVPLREEDQALVPVVRVFSALSAACVVMLTAFASKHPLRGGIDVGFATEIGPVKFTEQHWSGLTFWNLESQDIQDLLSAITFGDTLTPRMHISRNKRRRCREQSQPL